MKIKYLQVVGRDYNSPNARAMIPCSPAVMSATSAGQASGCILSMSIKPEIWYRFCPWAQSLEETNIFTTSDREAKIIILTQTSNQATFLTASGSCLFSKAIFQLIRS